MALNLFSISRLLTYLFLLDILNCVSFPQPQNYAALSISDSLGISYFNRITKLSCAEADLRRGEFCQRYIIVPIKKLLPLVSKNEEDFDYQGSDKQYHYFILWIKFKKGQDEIFSYAVKRSECTLKPELSMADFDYLGSKPENYGGKMLNINGKCIVQTPE